MSIMHKLLVVDEHPSVGELINQIINADKYYSVLFANSRTNAETIVAKQRPDLILLTVDSKVCLDIAENLQKKKDCPPFAIMGKTLDDGEVSREFKKLNPLNTIKLPFDMDDFCQRIEDACFMAEGMIDELTGLYKKPCFDFKLNKLMKKKTKGVFFCLSLNAYSFAANPSAPLQIQMAVYALKSGLSDGILGINRNVVLGFIPSQEPQEKTEAQINQLIEVMRNAAEGPEVFVPTGAVQSETYDFNPEDMFLYADKAMELSKNEGKNLVKFYK